MSDFIAFWLDTAHLMAQQDVIRGYDKWKTTPPEDKPENPQHDPDEWRDEQYDRRIERDREREAGVNDAESNQ